MLGAALNCSGVWCLELGVSALLTVRQKGHNWALLYRTAYDIAHRLFLCHAARFQVTDIEVIPFTRCSYQRDKRAKPGNLPKSGTLS